SFEETIKVGGGQDIIYCDPPYIDRHVDYYNGWDGEHEEALYKALSNAQAKFILSTWHHNNFRQNKYINLLWSRFNILTREHYYHVGAKENNRNAMIEALVTNYDTSIYELQEQDRQEKLNLSINTNNLSPGSKHIEPAVRAVQ
ncbi:MAG: DNA adenine methylase, partial [Candidatus Dadabacteria bacterium]|nr:DNA adenine methylase [Candidatus Dadabacteria bacterium]